MADLLDVEDRWGSVPAGVMASIASQLPPQAIASSRLVCSHWRTTVSSAVDHVELTALPELLLTRGSQDSQRLDLAQPSAPPRSVSDMLQRCLPHLQSVTLRLPYHDIGVATDVASATAHLIQNVACHPKLTSLDLGFHYHLLHEPLLRKTCPTPILASQIPLLPALLDRQQASQEQHVEDNQKQQQQQGQQQQQEQQQQLPSLQLWQQDHGAQLVQLQHLTVLYDTLSTARGSYPPKKFRSDLPRLVSLHSLVINLRGAFTQEEAACVALLTHLTRLEVHSCSTTFLSCRTLQLLASCPSPLRCLLLGPCILNPTPSILGMLGALPSLTRLVAWVKCTSPVHMFSADSMAARCGRYDLAGLAGLRDLALTLEGYSEARSVRACLQGLPGLTSLQLVLRGLWQPGWDHVEEDGAGTGGWPAHGGTAAPPTLTRLALWDKRPEDAWHPSALALPHRTAAAPPGAPDPANPILGLFDHGPWASSQDGPRGSEEHLGLLLQVALGPQLVDLELGLRPAMGPCCLDRLPALCPALRRLMVTGLFKPLLLMPPAGQQEGGRAAGACQGPGAQEADRAAAGAGSGTLSSMQGLRELHLCFSSQLPHEKGLLDLACLPKGLRLLHLSNCTLCGGAKAATGTAAASPYSNPGSSQQQQQQQQMEPLPVLLPLLESLTLRHCSGDVRACLESSQKLTQLEVRRCQQLLLLQPRGIAAARDWRGSAAAGVPVPDAWLHLESLTCDCLQQLLGSFLHCCQELGRLRCLSSLCASLKAPADMADEDELWQALVPALPLGLRSLHLHLDITAAMCSARQQQASSSRTRALPPRHSGSSGSGDAAAAAGQAAGLLLLRRLVSLRELKLSGSGGELPNSSLTALQGALPYTAISCEDML